MRSDDNNNNNNHRLQSIWETDGKSKWHFASYCQTQLPYLTIIDDELKFFIAKINKKTATFALSLIKVLYNQFSSEKGNPITRKLFLTNAFTHGGHQQFLDTNCIGLCVAKSDANKQYWREWTRVINLNLKWNETNAYKYWKVYLFGSILKGSKGEKTREERNRVTGLIFNPSTI